MNSSQISVGCVHGRFQPPHLDHLEYMLAALKQVKHLIIGIAQPDAPHLSECEADPHRAKLPDNPLTYVERTSAIERMLTSEGVASDRFSFAKFPIDRPSDLAANVPTSVVCFTTIRDEWNLKKIEVLRHYGYDVRVLWDKRDDPGISGTEIRKKIRSSDTTWRQNVHKVVADYLVEEHLVDRMKLD